MSIADKFMNLFGEDEIDEEFDSPQAQSQSNDKSGVSLAGTHSTKYQNVVICAPKCLEEAQAMTDHLKNRKQVIVNFENTPLEISQKIIDFLSGAAYALDGEGQQIGQQVFLFAPSSVEIIKENKDLMETSRRNWHLIS